MNRMFGYYNVCLELGGFKTPIVVYAGSSAHAALKALEDMSEDLPGARVHEVEGPYVNVDQL